MMKQKANLERVLDKRPYANAAPAEEFKTDFIQPVKRPRMDGVFAAPASADEFGSARINLMATPAMQHSKHKHQVSINFAFDRTQGTLDGGELALLSCERQ